jgi:hypothetical protein
MQVSYMSKAELRSEINKVLNSFSDKALEELYSFLIPITSVRSGKIFLSANFKLISFAAYDNNLDVRIKFQFFSKF